MIRTLHNSGRLSAVFQRNNFLTVRSTLQTLIKDLDQVGLSPDVTQRIEIIVAEVANNIVEHGCKGYLDVTCTLKWRICDDAACIMIADCGPKIPNLILDTQGPFPEYATLPEGGFGLGLIETLCDTYRYKRFKERNYLMIKLWQN